MQNLNLSVYTKYSKDSTNYLILQFHSHVSLTFINEFNFT
jgi:hypothetical protein